MPAATKQKPKTKRAPGPADGNHSHAVNAGPSVGTLDGAVLPIADVPIADVQHIAPVLRGFAVRVDSLTRDPDNARLHGERDLPTTTASLRRFGQQHLVHFDPATRVIKIGNGRHEAAEKILGWTWIAAVPSNLSGAELKAFALADNRSAELSEWDPEAVERQLQELADEGIDAAEIGFTEEQIEALLEGDVETAHGFSPRKEKPERDEPEMTPTASQFKIILSCTDERQHADLIREFEERGFEYTAPNV